VIALAIIYLLFSLAFALQVLVVNKIISNQVQLVIQSILEFVMFFSALAYSLSDDAFERWPFS